jgi:hypothetical protein
VPDCDDPLLRDRHHFASARLVKDLQS